MINFEACIFETPKDEFELSEQDSKSLDSLKQSVNDLSLVAENLDVEDRSTAITALEMACQSRKLNKRLDDLRKEIVRPHIDFQKSIKTIVDGFGEKLAEIENGLVEKIGNYRKEKDTFKKIETVEGNLSISKDFQFRIESEEKIPSEYLTVNKKAVEDAIKRGIRNISGIKIIETEKVSIRTKN